MTTSYASDLGIRPPFDMKSDVNYRFDRIEKRMDRMESTNTIIGTGLAIVTGIAIGLLIKRKITN